MSYRIEFLSAAQRQLAALPAEVRRRIARRLDILADDPRPANSEALTGNLKGRRRLRVGDYRVIYTVEDDILVVLVVSVGHRRSGYRQTGRAT